MVELKDEVMLYVPRMLVFLLSRVWQYVKLSDVSLGTRPRHSLVVDEDVKKPNKQTGYVCFFALVATCLEGVYVVCPHHDIVLFIQKDMEIDRS